jgi:hypothetical protein
MDNIQPPVPTLSPLHTLQPVSPRSILIPFFHLHLPFPSGLFPSGFPTKTFNTSLLFHACHMPCPPQPPWLDLPNIWGWVQLMKLLTVQLPPLSRHIIPLWSKRILRTLFSNILSLCSSLSVRDQVSHPYKITGRIMVLYILQNHLNSEISCNSEETMKLPSPTQPGKEREHCCITEGSIRLSVNYTILRERDYFLARMFICFVTFTERTSSLPTYSSQSSLDIYIYLVCKHADNILTRLFYCNGFQCKLTISFRVIKKMHGWCYSNTNMHISSGNVYDDCIQKFPPTWPLLIACW